jgi:ribosomal protein S21
VRLLKKTHHKKGLVEWLKVYALSSNPSMAKKKKKNKNKKKGEGRKEEQEGERRIKEETDLMTDSRSGRFNKYACLL